MTGKSPKYKLEFEVGTVPLVLMVDSGADVSIIKQSTWNYLNVHGVQVMSRSSKITRSIGGIAQGSSLEVLFSFDCKIKSGEHRVQETIYVAKNAAEDVISGQAAEALHCLLIGRNVFVSVESEEQFPVIEGYTVKIHTRPDVKPIAHRYRPVPLALEAEVEAYIQRFLRLGIIERVPEGEVPQWVSQIVPIKKKSGKLRICVDLRDVNKAIVSSPQPSSSPDYIVTTAGPGEM